MEVLKNCWSPTPSYDFAKDAVQLKRKFKYSWLVRIMLLGWRIPRNETYSILVDESSDISGKEQLSIGVRFFDEENMMVREEFLGFVELTDMDAKSVASAINNFIEKVGLDPEKCVGKGYDGCSTMAGKDGGVQSILRKTYTRALYFHCASHKLNLVVNDLNISDT
ncbi:hypothetical protein J437_LFUL015642 [Ladona fulva]|uniref:DUF4371 domain-containing protein n=1 Tax=Ladona fulva TaxID=123851 RepID=A0A8K0KJ90_LADFU|nr:hypothetical protein J437_LFUL015642 [Ladona fulva]